MHEQRRLISWNLQRMHMKKKLLLWFQQSYSKCQMNELTLAK